MNRNAESAQGSAAHRRSSAGSAGQAAARGPTRPRSTQRTVGTPWPDGRMPQRGSRHVGGPLRERLRLPERPCARSARSSQREQPCVSGTSGHGGTSGEPRPGWSGDQEPGQVGGQVRERVRRPGPGANGAHGHHVSQEKNECSMVQGRRTRPPPERKRVA